MRILLGVSAGIAAYKAALLLRLLTESGHDVHVVPTRASLEFVGAATWEALSGHRVTTGVFEDVPAVEHVSLGKQADLVVVAPATADLLARAASGRADDLLTAALLTARCPVLMAPAMHTEMWEHPATRANVALLRERGVHVLEPDSGRLTGQDTGPGRLPEPAVIAAAALALVAPATGSAIDAGAQRTVPSGAVVEDLAGRRVVVSAGGTREPLDPVRFLGNRSTGRQGYALAETARRRGAQVTLVAANVSLDPPPGVDVVPVETTDELREAVRRAAARADVIVMAAAVADFRPLTVAGHKIKKDGTGQGPSIELVANPDVLAELAADRLRPGQLVVGFAAETGDSTATVLEHGRAKARRKGADLLAVNAVGDGRGFASADNAVTILDAEGGTVSQAEGSKSVVADALWDAVLGLLRSRSV
ncbi:bifunctional phosphopantothenoylcysteine decarboxylase/phosphopantothenate--cysteine ligase CoaBC [Actinotalea sp. K2]|uniref:bifunctional phosphopantothenoylcysteine decarboxylase/phosphopantothenate--cysteine ligase CoaBC n=1 Tax=Actinotalea sp. K2 TaxID=2939438 RepID=UPI0020174AC7|nr:bifunctional phosphopantothenoylcysteine decarboxylase/phosphopantothenate--cysteine ligase CoaBC [Actinotalea sp. K2]MCL3862820.1 bifunctional phosphopantothenoylcysteine decarboxylase/phosphopantothenate--cysteine ligase CoaBC [Actinotalea sp. K2]